MSRYEVIRQTQAGLLYENGKYVRTLAPGRYRISRWPGRMREIVRIDLRRTEMAIAGQEILTSDALSVRVNVAVSYRVIDAARAAHETANYYAALYSLVQIVLREEVQARTLDELLQDRSALSAALKERGQDGAREIGLELVSTGVKDIILPGDVKRMLSQEIEALRQGRAALVAAREETAAMRAKANTAQILAGNPVLLRLREIEALAQVSGGMGNTVVLAVPSDILRAFTPAAQGATPES
jgi:regulator of protease activity HflC (stomatin/prohibitin superfamily)